MTILLKTSSHAEIPDWMDKDHREAKEASLKTAMTSDEVKHLASLPHSLDDDAVYEEMDRIEKCASSGRPYHYPAEWKTSVVEALREYAHVCGIGDKFVAVATASRAEEQPASSEPVVDDEVSKQDPVARAAVQFNSKVAEKHSTDMREVIGDPFGFDRLEDRKAGGADWQKTDPARKLDVATQFSTFSSSAVVPIGGEYEYTKNPTGRVRPGQNSIADPDAIGRMIAEGKDTGERLRAENLQHAKDREAARKSWQDDMVVKGKELGAGSMPRGSVHMTGAHFAQPGLRSSAVQAGVFQQELEQMPDKTDGEKIQASNQQRRASIQRPEKDRNEWHKIRGTSKAEVSDEFADSLEKIMKAKGLIQ